MQALTRHLTGLIYERKQFKIKFQQYDNGTHIFYPNYHHCRTNVCNGDLVAWMWGNSLKIGLVKVIKGESLKVRIVGRKGPNSMLVQATFDKRQLLCIFQPDS
jgi:hypothetical protein